MTPPVAVATDPMFNPDLAAAQDFVPTAAHLIRFLERQPACVMRVGVDGALLAINDAALGLLGATELGQVLGTLLTDRLVPEHQAFWRDFADRVWKDTCGSVECDIVDISGTRRTVLLQGVALPDHPDGIRSVIAAARDISATRRLENALQELERTRQGHEADRQQADDLRTQLEAALAKRKEAAQAMDALRAQLQQAIAEGLRLETAAEQDIADRQQLGSALEQYKAERQQFESAIEQYKANRQQLESAIGQYEADRQRLESALGQREADRQRLESALGQREADRQRLESALEQREADRLQLQSTLDESLAERLEFESALRKREVNRQRLLAEYATARVHAESALAEAASQNDQLTKRLADQGLDLQRTEENARRLESLAAAGRLAIEVARELQTIVGALDARAKDLLAKCPVEADEREEIEIFRGAAIRATSLARQIVQAERTK